MSKLHAGLAALFALIIGVFAAIYIAPPSEGHQPLYLSQYPQVRALPDFQLVDHNAQTFTKEKLLGHWSLVFVGYTYCPDICPTTLAELKSIYPELQNISSDFTIQVIFVSVDPKRDTPERLNEYVRFFNPDFIAVTGEHTELFPLVRALGLMYSMPESTNNPNYLVDHSASVLVIDPKAQVIGRFKPDFAVGKSSISEGQKILADMPKIMANYPEVK